MPKETSKYKRYNVAVPTAKTPGEINFRLNERRFTCYCRATFTRSREWERHLETYHKLSAQTISEIMGKNTSTSNNDVVELTQDSNTASYNVMEIEDDHVTIDNIQDDFDENLEEYMSTDEELDEEEVEAETDDDDNDEDEDKDEDEDEDENEDHAISTILYQMINSHLNASVNDLNNPAISEDEGSLLEHAIGEETTWNHIISNGEDCCYPFDNLQTMVMMCLVDGDNNMISRNQLKKFLVVIGFLFKIRDMHVESQKPFKLPTLNALFKYQDRKKKKVPKFPSKYVPVKLNDDSTITTCLNLPSEHLKLLMANPKKGKSVSSLPDRTENVLEKPQQGDKWKTNPYLQQPMWTVHDNLDIWYDDLIQIYNAPFNVNYIISSFHTVSNTVYARGFFTTTVGGFIGIDANYSDIPVSCITAKVPDNQRPAIEYFYSTFNGNQVPLLPQHDHILRYQHWLKRQKPNSPNKFYKIKISPITLFTDDTSGNQSKQFNPYESWSMRCAAMSFEERLSIENIFFIGAIPKKKGASGISLLPTIVEDLKKLEDGIVMFSAEDNENVLVVAPLLWIEADNPCHSILCGILGSRTAYPCRKCYICLSQINVLDVNSDYFTSEFLKRTRLHYCIAAISGSRSSPIYYDPVKAKTMAVSELSFVNRGTGSLLELKAFDPSKVTPCEILHTILLGIGKYSVNDLVKVVLSGNKTKLSSLQESLSRYQQNPSFGMSRKFTKQLRHCGSFLGRDYKILIQILPLVLMYDYPDDADLADIKPLFIKLGILSSLVFVRRIDLSLDRYFNEVQKAALELVDGLYHYDVKQKELNPKYNSYSTRLKTHLLTHLIEDIRRFGPALNFETEKGEQFNKHIREHLVYSNKLNTSRDIGKKFGKQYMIQHILQGGSWISEDNGAREKAGNKVVTFIREVHDEFIHYLFGGTREFIDNNNLDKPAVLRKNSVALFKPSSSGSYYDNRPFFAVILDQNTVQALFVDTSATSRNQGYLNAHLTSRVESLANLDCKAVVDAI